LTFEPSRAGQLTRYLAEINAGKSAAEAAKVFGDLRQLHRELERFLGASRITGYPIQASQINVGEITVRKLTPGEAATMDVRILSKRGVDEKTAPGVYEAAKKAAAAFPNDPGAQIVLAEAAYDAGDFTAAEAAADRAIAADPKAIDAYVYKAMARMAIADQKGDDSRETWRAIRSIIATANKLDPEDPEPLILYYRSYVEARQAPPQMAKDGLYRAFELAPYDLGLRMNVAQMLMYDGKPQEARILLLPLAYNPHGGGLAQAAKQMIARIDAEAKPAKAATN
jgi:tetratricopeptide (TPR) repeat protein